MCYLLTIIKGIKTSSNLKTKQNILVAATIDNTY